VVEEIVKEMGVEEEPLGVEERLGGKLNKICFLCLLVFIQKTIFRFLVIVVD